MLDVMRGRPPKPKHVLQLVGSKHAKNREELGTAPADGTMPPPEWLKPRGKEVFAWVTSCLKRMGTLAETDVHVITRYAVVFCLWEHAAKKLQEIDAAYIEVLDNGGSIRFSRATAMATQARECGEQLRHLETVLGLTPADRIRLGYGAVKTVSDPGDELFDDIAAG